MSFDVDEDILQDFLVEAGEILEQLQEQLVDLENNPEDADLLNAIFRGCLLYTSPSPRDQRGSRMPSSA